ncbi:hypothetical protein HK100_012784 [Physocladia obscura]|uniref:Uncharacterized protein n=1 Tax=Physocladia obscura TaxID=109957 RepID=A0AAD5XC86_9FUNG|nr:hypothetical protein HK100_012784 [Physocladia obscura]
MQWHGIGTCIAQRVTSIILPSNNIICSNEAISLQNISFPYYTHVLDLSHNIIPIFPDTVASLPHLSLLSFAFTEMTGEIPVSFLTAEIPLVGLNLTRNALTGVIATSSVSSPWLANLLGLDISGNAFEGWLPNQVVEMAAPKSVWLNGGSNKFYCPNISVYALNEYACQDIDVPKMTPGQVGMPSLVKPAKLYFPGLAYVPLYSKLSCIIDDVIIVNGTVSKDMNGAVCLVSELSPGIHHVSLAYDYSVNPTQRMVVFPLTVTSNCPIGSYLVDDGVAGKCFTCPTGGFCAGGTLEPVSLAEYFESPIIASEIAHALWNQQARAVLFVLRNSSMSMAIVLYVKQDKVLEWLYYLWWRQFFCQGGGYGELKQYPINWDSKLGDVVQKVSIAILNTDYINLQCAYNLSYYPLQGFCSFLMLLHVPLTDRALRLFVCVTDPYDNRYYISGTPEITCYDNFWYFVSPFAGIFAVLYGAGIPDKLWDTDVKNKFGVLYSSYTVSTWWWTPFQMMWSFARARYPIINTKKYAKPYKLIRTNHVAILTWVSIILFLFAGIIVGFLQSSNDDNFWIIASVLALFYASLIVVIHAFLHEIVHNYDNSVENGYINANSGIIGWFLVKIPKLRVIFPKVEAEKDDTILGKTDDCKYPVKTIILTPEEREIQKIASVTLNTAEELETIENQSARNLGIIKQQNSNKFSLSWIVDSGGEIYETSDGDAFKALPESDDNLGFSESSSGFMSKGIADAREAIQIAANSIAVGIRGTHVQIIDEKEQDRSEK